VSRQHQSGSRANQHGRGSGHRATSESKSTPDTSKLIAEVEQVVNDPDKAAEDHGHRCPEQGAEICGEVADGVRL
jgi:hypothetical protein